MSSTLHLKPEDVDTREKRAKYTVTIAGCEQNGLLYSCLFANAGYKVICTDHDQTLIHLVAKGKAPFTQRDTEIGLRNHVKEGHIMATEDTKTAISRSNIIIINTPLEIDQKKKPDYSNIEKTCKLLGANIRQDSLTIITSIVGVGVVDGLIRETLENTSGFRIGTEIGLAYSPKFASNVENIEKEPGQEQIVAASDKTSLNAASTVLETISQGTLKRTLNVGAAEIAVLFQAAQQEVNSALANEFAFFCEKAGLDYFEAQGLGTHATAISSPAHSDAKTEDASYLFLEDAENLSVKLRTLSVARETNEEIARHAANLVGDALRSCGRTFTRAKVSMLGISETPNMKSPPKRLVKKLAKIMETRGAKISIYDPYFSSDSPDAGRPVKKTLNESLEGANCIVLITPHDQFRRISLNKLKILTKMPAAIVDLTGILEPDKVEKEGFIYRGLGRKVLRK
ncbi:MAG TPA: UDP binding domain-containing protein [Candidatus Acidoferrum sp.]|nr:UDP binding domain-containing protein [Candidatus Acidoferrum sp.]